MVILFTLLDGLCTFSYEVKQIQQKGVKSDVTEGIQATFNCK
jgi:hypothetical protein